ncbi:hypothetical protein GBA52_010641, partial [Prunus armeniaca]
MWDYSLILLPKLTGLTFSNLMTKCSTHPPQNFTIPLGQGVNEEVLWRTFGFGYSNPRNNDSRK